MAEGKTKGWVYLLGDTSREGVYKIGVTTGFIENRIKELQTGNSGEIYIVARYHTKHPFFIEKKMHARHLNYHEHGEWYNLPPESVFTFEKDCKWYEDMLLSLSDNPFIPDNLRDI